MSSQSMPRQSTHAAMISGSTDPRSAHSRASRIFRMEHRLVRREGGVAVGIEREDIDQNQLVYICRAVGSLAGVGL